MVIIKFCPYRIITIQRLWCNVISCIYVLGGIISSTSVLHNPIIYQYSTLLFVILLYTLLNGQHLKEIYIDSRYKTYDSVSNSNCKFEIREGIDLPDNRICYIDDVSIPHTWYTI